MDLRIERPAPGVAMIVLARPDRLNALDDGLLLGLPGVLHELDADSEVAAIVITGEGRGFSAGADLEGSGLSQPTAIEAEMFTRATHQTPVAIRSLGKPSVAAVNGVAVGAGLGLALACDIRVAGRGARFGAPFVSMGLVPDYGVSYFLPRVVGTAHAIEMLLTGRLVEADEALSIGLVSRVVDDPVANSVALAATMAAGPAHAVRTTRGNVYRGMELGLEAEVLEQEVRAQAVALKGSEFAARFEDYRSRILSRSHRDAR